jgi:hypothetical protein
VAGRHEPILSAGVVVIHLLVVVVQPKGFLAERWLGRLVGGGRGPGRLTVQPWSEPRLLSTLIVGGGGEGGGGQEKFAS